MEMSSSFLQNAFLAWILSVCCFPNVSLKKRLTVAFQKGAHKQEGDRAKGNGFKQSNAKHENFQ